MCQYGYIYLHVLIISLSSYFLRMDLLLKKWGDIIKYLRERQKTWERAFGVLWPLRYIIHILTI